MSNIHHPPNPKGALAVPRSTATERGAVIALGVRRPQPASAPTTLYSELKELAERAGSSIGDGYAFAARYVLTRVERLADQNAERRYRERVKASARARARASVAGRAVVASTDKSHEVP